jgi:peptidoglycan hydrolase-like protein with peptidoglycan-binding domain
VRSLQYLLNAHGACLMVDGIFGPKTDAWVRAFQSAIAGHVIGFVEDGVVGPLTWSLLVTGEKPDPLYQSP